MFAGEYPCKLDEKGRFALPSSLRDYFVVPGQAEAKKVVLVRSAQEQCLWLFPLHIWHAVLASKRQALSDEESRLFMHFMVSDVVEMEIDRTSRVLVPRKLREHAGIDEEAILVGMYDRLEVWGSRVWAAHLSHLEDAHDMSLGKVLSIPSITPSFSGAQALP